MVGILTNILEADTKIFDDIKVIAVAVEATGLAIEQDSFDIRIVSESLSEGCFPFVTVSVCLQPKRCGCGFANGFGVIIECRLTVVGILAVQQVKRKAERKSSVIVINDSSLH